MSYVPPPGTWESRAPVELDLGNQVLVLPLTSHGELAAGAAAASATGPPEALGQATVVGVNSPGLAEVQAVSLLTTVDDAVRIAPRSADVALVVVGPTA